MCYNLSTVTINIFKERGKQMPEEQINQVEQFYKYDLKIKDSMLEIAPRQEYSVQERKYRGIVLNAVKLYKECFKEMITFLNLGEKYTELIEEKLGEMIDYLYEDLSYEELRDFYEKGISHMSKELIASVNETCVGYSLDNDIYDTLKMSTTINEILHVLHSYLLNHEQLYERMPVCIEERNGDKYVRLTGIDNELAREVYSSVSSGINSDNIDILSLENKMIMMFRDLGHALSVELKYDLERNRAIIDYFIPKVCDLKKIRRLNGIRNYNDNYAKGTIFSTVDNLLMDLHTLLEAVPTDMDMIGNHPEQYDDNRKMVV